MQAAPTLSDRLNPTHPGFDADLKARWKSLSKAERAALVEADRAALAVRGPVVDAAPFPFRAEEDDHCETDPASFRDIAPLLDSIAARLGKTRATLAIYDPYYCAGSSKTHLSALGFTNVYHRREDFYGTVAGGRAPDYDVMVTNPPFSGSHVEKLLRIVSGGVVRAEGDDEESVASSRAVGRLPLKPFLLLMPTYVYTKPAFLAIASHPTPGAAAAAAPSEGSSSGLGRRLPISFFYPASRYVFWTPKGLREGKKQAHSSAAGSRTSPFPTMWYACLDPDPAVHAAAVASWAPRPSAHHAEKAGASTLRVAATPAELPRAMQSAGAPQAYKQGGGGSGASSSSGGGSSVYKSSSGGGSSGGGGSAPFHRKPYHAPPPPSSHPSTTSNKNASFAGSKRPREEGPPSSGAHTAVKPASAPSAKRMRFDE